MSVKQILRLIVGWRLVLVLIALVGIYVLPFKDSFPYRELVLEPQGHPLFYSWANFDGVHYLGIADKGYWAQFTQAFFPVYPILIRWVTAIVSNSLLSGLIISHLSLIVALFYLYELIKIDYSNSVASRVLWLLLLFPTSFFFGAVYTESLFLMLVVTSFYAMRKGLTKEAILLATFATATRIVGIFLIPALIYESISQNNRKLSLTSVTSYLPFMIPLTGIGAYMVYLYYEFSDPLYFLNAQPAFGAQRSSDQLILLYQVIFRYLKMFWTIDPWSLLYFTVNLEFWLSIGALGLLIWAWIKGIRKSYLLYAFGAYFLPTLTGTFSSMPRYVLILFPIFIVLAQIKSTRVYQVILFVFGILLAVNTILFTRGYWVA